MEKNNSRSAGVTFWAWTFILLNLAGFFTAPGMVGMYTFLSKKVLGILIVYALLSSIMGIVTGINILRLRKWARQLCLVLVILGLFQAIVFVPFNHRYAENLASQPKAVQIFEKQYDNLPPETKAKINMTKEQFVYQVSKINSVMVGGVMGFFELLLAVYLFVLLWFFTKLNVKKQFGHEDKKDHSG